MSVASETTLSGITALRRSRKLKITRSSTAAKPITPSSLSSGGNASITPGRITTCTKKAPNSETVIEGETPFHETVAAMELPLAQKSGNQMADDMLIGDATPVVTAQVIPMEKESDSPATPAKEPEAETQGMASIEDAKWLGNWFNWRKELSRDQSPNAVNNSAADATGANENTAMVLPFVKQSPIWKAFESMEGFKAVKLFNLIDRVKNLQLDVPRSTLERLKECFFELEKYGFDVTAPISRIDMLFSLKDKQVNLVEELKDLREVECKIIELRSQEADLKEKMDALEKKFACSDAGMCSRS